MKHEKVVEYVEPRADKIMTHAGHGCYISREIIEVYDLVRNLPTTNVDLEARLAKAVGQYGQKYDKVEA